MRSFDRLFSEAAAAAAAAEKKKEEKEESCAHQRQLKRQRMEEEALRQAKAPMTVEDAIRRIMLAYQDGDYFRLLELPPPSVDALGRAEWNVSNSEISKAYRKLSILVHPDKNPGEDARKAFEALNEAHRFLKDAGKLEEMMKTYLEKAKERKEKEESMASLEDRIALNATKIEEAKKLRRKEAEDLHQEVLRQMREKQEKAKRRKELARKRDYGEGECEFDLVAEEDQGFNGPGLPGEQHTSASEAIDSDDDLAESRKRRNALAKRRQQLQKKRGSII